MSVHPFLRPDGSIAFKVRWRENGRQRGRTFDREDTAIRWDLARRDLAQAGELDVVRRAHTTTLNDITADWLLNHAVPGLNASTVDSYTDLLDDRILPVLGEMRLQQITPQELERWVTRELRKGTGGPTIRKCLAILQGIFTRAEGQELVRRNPVKLVANKPSAKRTRIPPTLSPAEVERIRAAFLVTRKVRGDALRHRTMVAVLAYSGPRPESELVPLRWNQIKPASILYRRTKHKGDKVTERPTVLLDPLKTDLLEWRLSCGNPGPNELVFPDPTSGKQMTGEAWDRWRDRIFKPAAVKAGLEGTIIPRDLRGSFASLLVWEGRNIVEVASQLGHSVQTCTEYYLGVFADFDPALRLRAADAIRAARKPKAKQRRRRVS